MPMHSKELAGHHLKMLVAANRQRKRLDGSGTCFSTCSSPNLIARTLPEGFDSGLQSRSPLHMCQTFTEYAIKRIEIRKRHLSKEICVAVLESSDKQICLSDVESRPERRIHQQKSAGGHGLYRVIVNPSTGEILNSYYTGRRCRSTGGGMLHPNLPR